MASDPSSSHSPHNPTSLPALSENPSPNSAHFITGLLELADFALGKDTPTVRALQSLAATALPPEELHSLFSLLHWTPLLSARTSKDLSITAEALVHHRVVSALSTPLVHLLLTHFIPLGATSRHDTTATAPLIAAIRSIHRLDHLLRTFTNNPSTTLEEIAHDSLLMAAILFTPPPSHLISPLFLRPPSLLNAASSQERPHNAPPITFDILLQHAAIESGQHHTTRRLHSIPPLIRRYNTEAAQHLAATRITNTHIAKHPLLTAVRFAIVFPRCSRSFFASHDFDFLGNDLRNLTAALSNMVSLSQAVLDGNAPESILTPWIHYLNNELPLLAQSCNLPHREAIHLATLALHLLNFSVLVGSSYHHITQHQYDSLSHIENSLRDRALQSLRPTEHTDPKPHPTLVRLNRLTGRIPPDIPDPPSPLPLSAADFLSYLPRNLPWDTFITFLEATQIAPHPWLDRASPPTLVFLLGVAALEWTEYTRLQNRTPNTTIHFDTVAAWIDTITTAINDRNTFIHDLIQRIPKSPISDTGHPNRIALWLEIHPPATDHGAANPDDIHMHWTLRTTELDHYLFLAADLKPSDPTPLRTLVHQRIQQLLSS